MSSGESEEALANHVRAERVRFVFIQSALPIFFSPLAATILSLALSGSVSRTRLLTWTVGLFVIAVMRVLLIRTYPKEDPGVEVVRRWERTFVASIVLVDLWWGVGALFLLTPSFAERALVFSFLIMMAGGHSQSYAAHPATVLFGVLSLVVPITLLFALQPDALHRAMAFAAVMYLAASLRSINTLSIFFGRNHRLAHELQLEKDRVEKLARTDFLTGLNNRRAFYDLSRYSLRHARRYSRPAALLMLDVDHFKAINDKYGHAAGDAVLVAVAKVIREHHRATDTAGRLGGEEFAVLLPETPLADAMQVAERLREKLSAHVVEYEQETIRFTTSLGLAEMRDDETLDELIARADTALYDAKRSGRNRVVSAAA